MQKEIASLCKIVLSISTGTLNMLFGGFDVALKTLIWLMVIDYITGVLASIVEGKKSTSEKSKGLNSTIGLIGIVKKLGMICLVMLACLIDYFMGMSLLRNVVVIGFIFNEGISILENSDRMGIPYPQQLRDCICKLKTSEQNTDTKN